MLSQISLLAVITLTWATIYHPVPYAASVVGPIYSRHVNTPKVQYQYTATDVENPHGAVKQQTAVGKDSHGGHSIRHSAQATHHDPYTGQTAVKHNEHAFHINPYFGQAAVHTNNAEGALNPHAGAAAFQQKTHDAQIHPGHTSVLDTANTAAVVPHGTAASQDVRAASADVIHDGVARSNHASHKSYSQGPHIGGTAKALSSTEKRFDGHGYGNLQYQSRAANQAYDPYGHKSANEAGYDISQAYDERVGLGASNELEYSRHAAQDPHGNYGAVSKSRHSTHGGHLIPTAYVGHAAYKRPVVHAPPPVYVPAKAVAYAPVEGYVVNEAYGPPPPPYYYHA